MDDKNKTNKPDGDGPDASDAPGLGAEGESLEFGSSEEETTVVKSPGDSVEDATAADATNDAPSKQTNVEPPKKRSRFQGFWDRFNIYLLLFVLLIIIAITVVSVMYFKNRVPKTATEPGSIAQQKLSSEALQQLAATGVQVGDPKQVLSVQSNSVFAGTVLVKGELQVAGGLKIGSGGLNIPDVNIGGTALINELQAKSLSIAGNGAIQGQLTVQQGLSVNGNAVFNGSVSTPQLIAGKLQISGDLAITRHLVAGGSIPGRTNGSLGSGGTSSISGADTAGSVSINTGSGAAAGCLVTVNFAQGFASTPHITITPVGAGAAGLSYYINRTTSNFSICTANAPPSNQTFGFDYMALD